MYLKSLIDIRTKLKCLLPSHTENLGFLSVPRSTAVKFTFEALQSVGSVWETDGHGIIVISTPFRVVTAVYTRNDVGVCLSFSYTFHNRTIFLQI